MCPISSALIATRPSAPCVRKSRSAIGKRPSVPMRTWPRTLRRRRSSSSNASRPACWARRFKIELLAGTELQQVQRESPPGEEAFVVGAGLLDAGIVQAIQPGVEIGKEVADGLDQGPAGDQG